ncbi:MAG: hypothetical protein L0K86_04735 [Actinomycetia bacterium]|nr:hypothetical protein [Actinomycetes bacterium]
MLRQHLILVALLGVVTACSNGTDNADSSADSPSPTTSEEVVHTDNDDSGSRDVAVGIYQLRQGYGSREMQIQVTNNANKVMRVKRATYVSSRFEKPATWSEGTRIPGDFTIDLPIDLARTRCSSGPHEDKVILEFRRGNNTLQRKTYEPELMYDAVQRFVDSDCAGRDLLRIADIHVGDDITIRGDGRKSVADLPLIIEPTGKQGSFTFESILATTLISPSAGGDSWDLGIEVAGSDDPQRQILKIRPTRCDSHALSDNSQGTEFTAVLELAGGQSTRLVLGTSRHLAGRLTSFVAAHCGYGPDVD